MSRTMLLLIAGIVFAQPGGADSAPVSRSAGGETREWPRWRGRGFDGVSREQGVFSEPFRLAVRWRRDLGSGYSGVVVADGRAVTMFSDGRFDYLVSLDAESGAERWRLPVAATNLGREGATDGPVSTPAINGGVVFALGPRGELLAVDLESGEPIWKTQLADRLGAPVPHWGFGTSPLVAGELLIVLTGGTDGRAVTAFDRRSGEPMWHAGEDNVTYQSPILAEVAGREQLIISGDNALAGLDPVTGQELWRFLHDGDQFFRKIVNPVIVGTDRLLLTNRRPESKLIRLRTDGNGIRAEEEWTTSHLKRNYSTPVHEGGYLYGYSGGFLSSVDARTGELAWKSRPPGDGWPILVDGHLVVLTKRGTLHVAAATPREFRQKASLDLFSKLVWTPPSFAYGRIYARDSYSQVACVDVVASALLEHPSVAESPVAETPVDETLGRIPQSRFGRWIDELTRAPDRSRRVRQWRAEQETFPVIEGDRWAHIVYFGAADDLALRISTLQIGEELAMHRVEGTDFYYASFELEPDARINYQFVRDLGAGIPDPSNPLRSASLVYGGEVSQLLMPAAERPPNPAAETGSRGTIETFDLETEKIPIGAKTWGGSRKIQVYLPPGYQDDGRRYETLYVFYGEEMLGLGMDAILDSLIGSRIQPLIVVFVASISPYEYARSQQPAHGRMIVDQLIPLIDGRYRTLGDGAHRAVAGVDEAGFAALELGVRYPRIVGRVSAQSVLPIGKGGEQLLRAIADADQPPIEVYLDWGRYDLRDSRDGTDVAAYGRQLREALESRGCKVTGRQWNDGPDGLYWGWRLERMLEILFPLAVRR